MNQSELRVSTVARTRCAGAGCGRGGGGAAAGAAVQGLRLCPGCLRLLARDLRELPALYEELAHRLGGGGGAGARERVSGNPGLPGMPFNEAAADVRTAVLATLGSWAGLVSAQLRVPAPERAVGRLCAFLLLHGHWLAAHPAAAEAADEIARLAAAARRVGRGTPPPRRVRVGACVARGCAGTLVADFRGADTQDCTAIRCDADPAHTWPGERWTELRRALCGQGERWLSAGEVARLWSVSTGTVYRLASEQHWRRRSRAGRTSYAEADVHACFARRAAGRAAGRSPGAAPGRGAGGS
ncbi:hypothetical protein ABZV77_41580 [Streptomyces sp. NPDC004732]|uniref:hypothetical protein n=1 Tax=Streptomyces sp. NPDC004732 TaxID=3154290 RepID=UPI0033BAB13C